ncbi:type II toxin-antitoxin system prevent-host-death family antitoxin [Nocardia sp. BMG51109]|uniref:type II toxin-antitoxin system prevent-host-death family antitoxin n=1 Tax=Nocardia sp. BMG51109 TaxID=1056816 RepID=UPI0004645339|nr:type II toxin-antitoxin system prevent-host-death family antitoxin [Nocardia sp. BMG51109]
MAEKSADSDEQPGRMDIAWPLAEAKARLSELIDTVEREGPQVISKHGREVAVVVAVDEWRRKAHRKGNLAEFFAESPLRGADLEIERADVRLRDIEL